MDNFFDQKEIWTIIGTLGGVILGFSLTEISKKIQENKQNKRIKNALFSELEGNLYAIKQKKDIIKKVIISLEKKTILPAYSVPLPTAVFYTNTALIITLLTHIESDNVQHIYGRIRLIDSFLDNFEDEFLEALKDPNIEDPFFIYTTRFRDILNQCDVTQKLIKSFLQKNPIDIYYRKQKILIEEDLM